MGRGKPLNLETAVETTKYTKDTKGEELAEALAMGYETRVSQAVSWVEGTLEAEVVALKRKLEQKA